MNVALNAHPVVQGGGFTVPSADPFGASNAVIIQQETSMCCRCCCCQPNIDFKMQDYSADTYAPGNEIQNTWAITEAAALYPGRCCSCMCAGARPTTWTVKNASGETIMSHSKGMTCSHCPTICCLEGELVKCPCCCCLPYMDTYDERQTKIGTTKYVCDSNLCIPKFDVLDANEQRVARIRPDVCCCGCCMRCRTQPAGAAQQGQGRRRKRLRVPFVVRKPEEPWDPIQTPTGNAAITDLWTGLANECCTKKDVFTITFPPEQHFMGNDSTAMKKLLVGSTLLVQMLMYEHHA